MQLTSAAAGTTISRRSEQVIAVLVSRREPIMWGRAVVGFVLCAVGTLWILQGTKVIQGSGMSGQGKWAAIGAVVLVAGLACFVWAAKHHRNGTIEAN
jgi:vacuolar-type H+-ATPase subunit I/STV1